MDFQRAIEVAQQNAKTLVPGAKNFALEEAVVSGKNYEITLSYFLEGKSPLELNNSDNNKKNNLFAIASIMGMRREYKIFLVDKTDFSFKGFRTYKES